MFFKKLSFIKNFLVLHIKDENSLKKKTDRASGGPLEMVVKRVAAHLICAAGCGDMLPISDMLLGVRADHSRLLPSFGLLSSSTMILS